MRAHMRHLAVLLVILVTVPTAAAGAAQNPESFTNPNAVTSADLVEQPKRFDGRDLTFQGEAIGEAMKRPNGTWLHLNDDAYMYANVEEGTPLQGYNSGMPVWVPTDLALQVTTFGDYKHEGDVVEVTGRYNAACAQHGGDTDIHATELKVLARGHVAEDPVRGWKLWLALGLTGLSGVLFVANRRMDARELTGWLRRR